MFDRVNYPLLHLVGKRVAVKRPGEESGGAGLLFKGGGIVPAGRGGASVFGWLFKKDADGACAAAEGADDARGQSVAGGSADHQHTARTSLNAARGANIINLIAD